MFGLSNIMHGDNLKPRKLEKGNTIGIIAPASSARHIDKRVFDIGIRRLQGKGFELFFGSHINKIYGHTAGTVEQRVEDLANMFQNPEINAIMSVYGGYNSHQLLPYINYRIIEKNPKVFIGFSDITALNIAIYKKTKLVNFSGPAFITFCQAELPYFTEEYFDRFLVRGESNITILPSEKWAEDVWWKKPDYGPREWKSNPGWKVQKEGVAEGIAIGGNVGTLLLLAGTEFFPDMNGKILFVEEDDCESPQTLDRHLTQLRHLGVYDQIHGLVIGRLPSKVGLNHKDSLEMILAESMRGYDFPIISEVDFAHTDPLITIPIGIRCRIDTYKKEIIFLESAVQ